MTDWDRWILMHEIVIRLGCFGGVLAAVAVWEVLAPCRCPTLPKRLRWLNNLGLAMLNAINRRAWSHPRQKR